MAENKHIKLYSRAEIANNFNSGLHIVFRKPVWATLCNITFIANVRRKAIRQFGKQVYVFNKYEEYGKQDQVHYG